MLAGQLNTDGHRRPGSGKGSESSGRILNIQQGFRKDILRVRKNDDPEINSNRKIIQAKKVFFTVTTLLGIIFLGLIISSLKKDEISTLTHMRWRQVELTGSDEFISTKEKLRREAEEQFKKGNYFDAYSSYKEIYKLGTTDLNIYLGLLKASEKVCLEDCYYCGDPVEWKKVIERIK